LPRLLALPQRASAALPRRRRAAEAPHDPAAADAVPPARLRTRRPEDAFLYQVGNKDVVRCLAECNEVLTLVRRTIRTPSSTPTSSSAAARCSIPIRGWGSADGFGVDAALRRCARRRTRRSTSSTRCAASSARPCSASKDVRKRCDEQFQALRRASFRVLEDFVRNLSALRSSAASSSRSRKSATSTSPPSRNWRRPSPRSRRAFRACVKFLLKPERSSPIASGRRAACRRGPVPKVAEGRKSRRPSARRRRTGDAHRDRQQPAHRGRHRDDADHRRHHGDLRHAEPGQGRAEEALQVRRRRGRRPVRRADEAAGPVRRELPRPLRFARPSATSTSTASASN
jgi:hypothetical protein